jgi:dihydrofolate reductase
MTKLTTNITMSLDGYVAGPNDSLENPLGERGELLHDWVTRLKSWREPHGREGGDTGPDDDRFREQVEATGAHIMGRRMFSNGSGPWEDDPKADGWWEGEPPFHGPVFILTHHARDPVQREGGTTYNFVTEGIESALEQACAAAGDKDVLIAGGASVVQQYLRAGLIDELEVHVAPMFLGGGVRLFDDLGADVALEQISAIEGNGVAHLRYRLATPG